MQMYVDNTRKSIVEMCVCSKPIIPFSTGRIIGNNEAVLHTSTGAV